MKISNEIKSSSTLNFNTLIKEKIKKGEKIISLGLGEPDFETPYEIVQATIDALKNGFTKYSDSKGLPALREKIATKFQSENNITVSPDNIVVTLGAKQAILISLMAILRPGDEIINFSPCYVSYIPQIKIAEPDCTILNIDHIKNDFSFPIDNLKSAINSKTKAILINYPHNPLGKVLSKSEVYDLITILENYPKCYIISDEIYEYLNFSNSQHFSIQSFNEFKNRVFTINGFSKSYSMTGWRIGYMSVPPDCIQIVSNLLQHMNTNIPTFIQKGSIAAFNINRKFINHYNLTLKNSSDYAHQILSKIVPDFVKPQAGFFEFINISKTGLTSDQFASKLLQETNVALNPGISFGSNWDDFVRVSLSGKSENVNEGINRLAEFIINYSG